MTEIRQKEIFTEWLNKYKSLLFKVVRSYATTRTDQDDLFQEICIQVWKSVPAFKEESAVTTWLYRISLNTALKWMQKEKKYYKNISGIKNSELLHEDNTEQSDERLNWLYKEITRLDMVDRSLTLLMLDGFSYKEMGHILGITESNAGVKIHRIKQLLIKKSKEYNHHGI